MAAGAIGLVACSSDKHAYSVKYDLNYDGAGGKSDSVEITVSVLAVETVEITNKEQLTTTWCAGGQDRKILSK